MLRNLSNLSSRPQTRTPKRWRFSWRLSSWLHLSLAGLILGEIWLGVLPPIPAPGGSRRTIELQAESLDTASQANARLQTLAVQIDAAAERAAKDAQAADDWANVLVDPATMQLLTDDRALDAAQREAAARFIEARVLQAIAEEAIQSPDDQFARLEALTGKLNQTASEESVDELKAKFQKWLATEDRATAPVEGAKGDFDFDTAQLHDVERVENPAGGFTYTSILIDSAGRQMPAPLSPEEGENLYRVMQLIKGNPLLERVYRGIVMSLIDRLAKPPDQRN